MKKVNKNIKGLWLLELEDIESKTSKIINRKQMSTNLSLNSKVFFYKDMILYSKLRPYLDKVLIAPRDGIASSEIVSFYSFINKEYLIFYYKSPIFIDYVSNLMYGVKMPRLGTIDMQKALIPVPPFKEQENIVDKINRLFQFIK